MANCKENNENEKPKIQTTKKRYEKNPFMNVTVKKVLNRKNISARGAKLTALSKDNKAVVDMVTGEVTENISMVTIHHRVERDQFVKLFSAGIALMHDLDTTGLKVFIVVLNAVQEKQATDIIYLNYKKSNLSKDVFYRGINTLISKQLLALAEADGMYWINPLFLWNGNRLSFVQEFVNYENKQKQI